MNRDSELQARIFAWMQADKNARQAVETERALRLEVFDSCFPVPKEGTNRKFVGPYNVSGVYKLNYNLGPAGVVDQALDAIAGIGTDGQFVADRLVSWSPKLMVSEYRILHIKHKRVIDKVLMISPAMPVIKVIEE